MRSLFTLFLLFCCFGLCFSFRQLFRIQVSNAKEMKKLSEGLEAAGFNVMGETRVKGGFVVDVVAENTEKSFLSTKGVLEVLVEDMDRSIQEERERIASRRATAGFFEEYQTLDSIYAFCNDLASNYPSLVSTFVLGRTFQGRDILGLKIRANRGASKEFFFNGGIHAREWISPATVLFMTNELVTRYGIDANVTDIVNRLDWTIVPVLNPDGYVYTFTNDRLWRKNRQTNSGSICVGTDMNRNWAYQWNTGGSSDNPCSDSFHGSAALSAPETKAISDYLVSVRSRLGAYIDFHAYSQLWMFPWGYSNNLTPDHTALTRIGTNAVNALAVPYGTSYDVGSIANIIYIASGSSADYAYGALGTRWSFGVELRDTGRYGFQLPPAQIIPSGIETLQALIVIAQQGPLGSN